MALEAPQTLTPVERFWRLLKPNQKEIFQLYTYAIFNGLIYLSLPLGIQAIVNMIQGGQISTSWIVLVGFVLAGLVFTGILHIYQLRITENLQQKIFTQSAFEFAYRIPRIRLEVLYKHYVPELMNRFFDTMSVQKGLSKILIDFSTASLQVFFGLILLSFYHSFFILFSVVLILLIYVVFRFTAKKGIRTSLMESKYKYQVAHWLEELARANITFKMAGITDLPMSRTDDLSHKYIAARESHFSVLIRQYGMLVAFKVIVAAGLLIIGGMLVMEQQMNIGQFVAAEIIILMVLASVEKLIVSMEVIYDVLTSLEKIGEITDMTLDEETGSAFVYNREEAGMEVELRDVYFSYPQYNKNTLSGINLFLEKGDSLCIKGANGSGKSTLLQVLGGLYRVHQGGMAYNGLPVGNYSLASLHASMGYCLMQEQLFNGTVLENISLGRKRATQDQVQWAIKQLGLDDFIRQLPLGYNTFIDPEGVRLPRSIVQKILLARAIVCRPKLLLLEDVLDHIHETERKEIIRFLTSPDNGWTMVAVSDDPYMMELCNKVGLMEDGTIKKWIK
ncbi:MAG: ATP-binding cassette domain-containing protein [Saprospiraceae bacterium]|nr:ATP-binding cassette domain-containing protein [Saprospiraceae bacterium]